MDDFLEEGYSFEEIDKELVPDGGEETTDTAYYRGEAVKAYIASAGISGIAAAKELFYDLPNEVAKSSIYSDEIFAGIGFLIATYVLGKKSVEVSRYNQEE